jgi:non-specific serine/threonine protein kinase/serine/threonine-protein kinase
MRDERAHRLAELVKSALECGPERWDAFLEQECGSDTTMRAEIESLLKQQEGASRFIESPALHLAAESLVREGAFHAGQIIGDYEILSLIGTGGMGEVYLAQDQHLHRKVALKLIRRGMDSEDIIRHFQREERLLASLNHPNIAQLYGSGVSADGIPFFAMEYVEGERLDTWCDTRQFGTQERLQLFRKVCSAVTYAHQHLVIHRDIKPANIRVTSEGEPKLLDFGIAKLLDAEGGQSSGQTVTLQGVMTPEYASPEQVRGENITTASDVYSLGVVLYELLTGQRPYRITSRRPDEIAHAITEQKPARPSTAFLHHSPVTIHDSRSLRGDLDNIVLMAMRKEPSRRYASVAQFSEDIRRHLEGLPVIARKDTVAYRTAKFVRRNKIGVAAAAVIALTLIVEIIATSWQAKRATREAKLAAQQRDRAEQRFSDVRRLSNALLFEIAPKIERLEGATEARQSLLTQSLKYLDSLAQESGEDRALQSELAAAYEKVGDLQGNPTNPNLMVLTDALASYDKANAMRRKLLEKNQKDPEQRRLLANNYRVLGDLRWQTNEPAESQKDSEAALRLYTQLLAEQPASTEMRLAVARTNYDIGQLFATNEKHADAIPYFEKVIAATEELRRQFPDRLDVVTLLANGRQQLGNALSWASRQKEGEAEMARAIEIFEPLVAANPNDANLPSGLYQTYLMTSSVYEGINDTLASEYAFKALQTVEKTVEKDPANLRPKHHLAMAYSRVGLTQANIGKAAESISYLEKAVTILQALAQNETMNRRFKAQLGLAFLRLGDARRKARSFQGAFEDLGKAAAIFSDLAATDASDNASLKNLASANKLLAEAHEEFAAQSSGEEKQSHQQMAGKCFARARDIFRQLEAQKTLSEFDRKALEETQTAVLRYERE